MSHLLKSRSRNSAFTLIELLVVIAIIGILASLATVGVMKVLERSKMVVARIEVSQLEAAVSAAKLDLGNVEELPSIVELYSNGPSFQAAANASNPNTLATFNVLTKAFGKRWYSATGIQWLGSGVAASTYATSPKQLSGMEALVFWLGGIPLYDASNKCIGFQGFSATRDAPWDISNLKRKGPYYDFDTKRIVTDANTKIASYLNTWEGPYVYISKSNYGSVIAGVSAYRKVNTTAPTSYYNANTFQIISSGLDQSFGSGGYYQPPFAIGTPGYDDLANFSSTQLGKKDE